MSVDDSNTSQRRPEHDEASARRRVRDDEIDLRELFSILWLRKWFVAAVTAAFAVVSVLVVLRLANEYKATAVLAPVSSSNLNSVASQLGGLAALAGITLGNGQEDGSQIAIAVKQSCEFRDKFSKQNKLQVEVFAAEGWDRDSDRLVIDSSLYDSASGKWIRTPPKGKTVEPTSWELYKRFSKILGVSADKKTGLISVSIEYYSP